MPPDITIWQAAAPPPSQAFLLVGAVVLMPIILAYTGLRLLGVPRQGAARGGLSLMGRRLLWFAALYVAGVLTVGVIAYGLKALLPHAP